MDPIVKKALIAARDALRVAVQDGGELDQDYYREALEQVEAALIYIGDGT